MTRYAELGSHRPVHCSDEGVHLLLLGLIELLRLSLAHINGQLAL